MTATAEQAPRADAGVDWWRGGVIYQIYPRSFQDTSGDGIGDLAGIAKRMPYVASLGVDAIWISPFFPSPMKDFGYDVSDYTDVDPMFGTLDDFDTLVREAHAQGLRVMIDLVLSHSSADHAWFHESRRDRDNPKADWYVWADPKPDGTPPNNWLSIFGGCAWKWDPSRLQYYLHNFLESQPDLNLHNIDVQNALLDIARFWLNRGVDGFRLDVINFYFADDQLRDNPALPPARRNASIAPSVNPYNYQEHIYSKNRPENLVFLKRFREVMDEYGAAAVGELGDAQHGMELLGQYTREGEAVQMCYIFDFLSWDRMTARRVAEVYARLAVAAPDGWVCWALSNHDVTRHVTRWNLDLAGAKCFAALLHCLRASVCLYQGEELGLTEATVAYEDIRDPYGIEFYPEFVGRDGCRTPMVWEASNTNGGFTEADRTWLPVAPEHLGRAVALQEHDDDALLHHYRAVIGMRRASDALRKGAQVNMEATGDLLTFMRAGLGGDGTAPAERVFCAFNLGDGTVEAHLPQGAWAVVEGVGATGHSVEGTTVRLGPWAYTIMRAA